LHKTKSDLSFDELIAMSVGKKPEMKDSPEKLKPTFAVTSFSNAVLLEEINRPWWSNLHI
jgi:hypothetical protein